MSKLLITKYHNQLHEILNAGGTRNETSITFAFANLLRAYAEKKNLMLVEQLSIPSRKGTTIRPDGVLKYFGGIELGYWEAKDGKDKLDVEINKKLNEAGYSNNIIFEDTQTAVLIQEGAEAMRVSMNEWNLLDDLLDKFINYEPAEVKEFNKALEKFKENVPSIVEGLRELMKDEAETNRTFREVRDVFLEIARSEINPEITPEDVREMIIQHILTEDIFTNVFADAEFHRSNNIARELENVIETFMTREVRRNYLEHIRSFYNAIRDAASGITDNHEKHYKEIDRRIKDTYIKNGTAQNQIVVYDMFTRFYRWSMDRLDKGIIAFITNRSFVDSRAFDGFRKIVEDEFDYVYIVDLRSDVRANPKIAGTTHNVFGI